VIDPPAGAVINRDEANGMTIMTLENYEPRADERIMLTWGMSVPTVETIGGAVTASSAGVGPAYDFIRVIRASSVYPGQTRVVDVDAKGKAQWWETTYGPAALFDRVRTNAWVEGVKGSGEGEFVEFELTQPAAGITVFNGLSMTPPPRLRGVRRAGRDGSRFESDLEPQQSRERAGAVPVGR
jgi:hypothetical protein